MKTSLVLLAAGSKSASGQGGAGMDGMFFFFIIATLAVLYFLILRPQHKEQQRQRDMIKNLRKGDDVITAGGIHGKIIDLDEHTVDLKISEGTKIKVERARIGRLVQPPAKGE